MNGEGGIDGRMDRGTILNIEMAIGTISNSNKSVLPLPF